MTGPKTSADITVKFNSTRVVDDFRKGTEDEERYEAGEIYTLGPAAAKRWIDRGVAVATDEKPKKASVKKAASKG